MWWHLSVKRKITFRIEIQSSLLFFRIHWVCHSYLNWFQSDIIDRSLDFSSFFFFVLGLLSFHFRSSIHFSLGFFLLFPHILPSFPLCCVVGGSSKVNMIVNLSPATENQTETFSSLNFASRVRSVELGQAKKNCMVSPLFFSFSFVLLRRDDSTSLFLFSLFSLLPLYYFFFCCLLKVLRVGVSNGAGASSSSSS